MTRLTRGQLLLAGLADLVLAGGYALQLPWAVDTWLWEDSRLTYIFLASMLTAAGVAVIWIAVANEVGSIPAGAINLVVTLTGVAAYLFLAQPDGRAAGLEDYAVGCAVLVVFNAVLVVRTWRLPASDNRPLPGVVRASYILFFLILLSAGLALILGLDGVMPWPLLPETSVVIGWIFFGDAFYFLYAVLRPQWGRAKAQLWSFLAYDVVLIPPLVMHYLDGVPDELVTNVVVYLVVLTYSGGLAVYYLFFGMRENEATSARREDVHR